MRTSKSLLIIFFLVIFMFSSTTLFSVKAQRYGLPNGVSGQGAAKVESPTSGTVLPVVTGEMQRKEIRSEARQNLLDAKAQTIENREIFRQEMMLKRQEATEQAKQKRLDFKAKTEEIKDQRKKELVQKLDEKISTLNQNRTDKMANVLDKLQTILDKISQKTDEASTRGVDTTSVTTAITSAQAAIATAKDAISNQAGKEYVITLTSEDEVDVKSNVGTTITEFRTDMIGVQRSIVEARKAVIDAAQVLKSVASAGGGIGNGTPSGVIAQ